MKNIKYIGIRGHRGSGKNTVAYLLGNVIQYCIDNDKDKNTTVEDVLNNNTFNIMYRICCEHIKNDESSALDEMNTPNVYLDSFGDIPRTLLQLITGIPNEYFYSDYYKDHVVVNLKDFSWKVDDNEVNLKSLCSAQTVIEKVEREGFEKSTIYLSLREFIVYFANVCMKYLGQNVWVKSMKASQINTYDDYYNIGTQYRIFRDLKAPSELTYVKDLEGIIIKVDRPKFKKSRKGVESLDNDNRFDYELTIKEDISTDEDLKRGIVDIVLKLIQS